MIYEVLGKLTTDGAALTLRKDGTNLHAPVPAAQFSDQLRREYDALIAELKGELAALTTASDLEYVWNIEGEDNILAKAREAIRPGQAARARGAGAVYLVRAAPRPGGGDWAWGAGCALYHHRRRSTWCARWSSPPCPKRLAARRHSSA